MTTQDAYDRIREYFHREGAQLAIEGSPASQACMYRVGRDPHGPGCAVGCLIPDELYDPVFDDVVEGVACNGPVLKVLRRLGYKSKKVLSFLEDAQAAHDAALKLKDFHQELDEMAFEYNLKVPA